MAKKNVGKRKSEKNHVLRNLFLIIGIVVLVIAVITYFQRKNGAETTLGDQINEKVDSVTESVKDKVSDVVESVENGVGNLINGDSGKVDGGNGGKNGDKNGDKNAADKVEKSDVKQPAKKSGSGAASGASGNSNVSDCDLGYAEDDPLFFGNPSDAYFNVSLEDNYLMEKENYTMSYNNSTLSANWVAWHLDGDDIGDAPRSNKFVADKDLPDNWHHVTKGDYQFNAYGFDRGHLCPSADRTYSADANNETFLMSNMVPQSSDNNRVVWVALEKYQREIVDNGNELYIFAGPAGTGGEGDRGYFDYIPVVADDGSELKINVPAYTWKIILAIPAGGDDLSRINEDATVIAVCVPNKKGINSDLSWKKYLCSVDDIENLTGFDFFELLEDDIEETLESRVISLDMLY